MRTIHDVAKLAGVSIGTVSNVLNHSNKVSEQTSARVRAAIKELNYTPNSLAKGLKSNQSTIVGIISEDIAAFSSGNIIDGICEYCESQDYSINLCNLSVNRKVVHNPQFLYKDLEASEAFKRGITNSVNVLSASHICGLIYIGTHPRDVENILPPLDIPVIYTYAYAATGACNINYDDYQGARLAVDYLIQSGHSRIAMVCGSIDSIPAHKRMLGYQAALMEHNLPLHPEYIRGGNWYYSDGYRQCQELLKLDTPPTAIFSMSDYMAYGAMNAALDSGLSIPDDLSICGFDGLEHSAFVRPALSTIHLPLREMGLAAAKTLLDLLGGRPPQEKGILLPCTLWERESVKVVR